MDADLAQGRIRIFQFPDEPAPGLSPPKGEPHRNDAPEGLREPFRCGFSFSLRFAQERDGSIVDQVNSHGSLKDSGLDGNLALSQLLGEILVESARVLRSGCEVERGPSALGAIAI